MKMNQIDYFPAIIRGGMDAIMGGLGLTLGLGQGGVGYDFRDEFWTARDAGAVNGTACEPGPGNRTVTDTENKITIADGKLVVAGQATPVWGECGIAFPSIDRVAGKIIVFDATVTASAGGMFGIGNNTNLVSYTDIIHVFNFGTLEQTSIWISPLNVVIDSINTTNRKLFCILRASGCYFFRHISGTTNLLFVTNTVTTSPVRPKICNYSNNMIYDFIRIPSARWLPRPLLSDGFSFWGESDGAGHAETTGVGSGGSGVTWTGSTWAVSGGAAYNTPCEGSELVVNGDMETGDPPTGWGATNSGVIAATADAQSGSQGMLLTSGEGSTSPGFDRQVSSAALSKWFKTSGYGKKDSASYWYVCSGTASGNTDYRISAANDVNYTLRYITFKSATANLYSGGQSYYTPATAGKTAYLDNISTKQLYLSTLVSFPSESATATPWLESVWSAKVDGTQWGHIYNADTNFAANAAATYAASATEITLNNVTKAVTAADTLVDKVNSLAYGIASVGALSAGTQTITLDAPGLTAEIASGVEVGIDYASWNGNISYYDGTANLQTWKIVNGTWTSLGSTAVTFNAASRLITRVGVGGANYVEDYYGEARVGTTKTKEATGKYHGLFSTDPGNKVANFVVHNTDAGTFLNAFIN